MPCLRCGCNKVDHEYTRDYGTGTGQCKNHRTGCKYYINSAHKDLLKPLFVKSLQEKSK